MSTTAQPTAQGVFGPVNTSGDILHFANAKNQVVSWIDSNGSLQGNFLSTTAVPSSAGTTTLTADSAHSQYAFTRTDNTFGSVITILNSAVAGYPANPVDYHQIQVNTDGQVTYQTFSTNQGFSNNISSVLNLDQDGHFSLAAGNGGGVATDSSTGETCIPYTTAGGSPSSTGTFRVSTTGTVSKYLGQATAGNGISVILHTTNSTGLSGNIGPVTLFTTAASGFGSSGLYRVDVYLVAAGNTGAATMTISIGYTDSVQANSQSTSAIPFATTGAVAAASFILESAVSKAITLTLTTTNTNYNGESRLTSI